jgi:hypothetical protein
MVEWWPPEIIHSDAMEFLFAGAPIMGKDVTMMVSESVEISVRVSLDPAGAEPVWKSEDESILAVVYIQGSDFCRITAISGGTAMLTCTVGEISDSLIVRIP